MEKKKRVTLKPKETFGTIDSNGSDTETKVMMAFVKRMVAEC